MPNIKTQVSVAISPEKEIALKQKLGRAITILGKSENWLMLEFCDNCRMYFKGEAKPMAFVEVSILGSAKRSDYEKLTGEICTIMNDELNIAPDCVYVKYEETPNWGWNNGNF